MALRNTRWLECAEYDRVGNVMDTYSVMLLDGDSDTADAFALVSTSSDDADMFVVDFHERAVERTGVHSRAFTALDMFGRVMRFKTVHDAKAFAEAYVNVNRL